PSRPARSAGRDSEHAVSSWPPFLSRSTLDHPRTRPRRRPPAARSPLGQLDDAPPSCPRSAAVATPQLAADARSGGASSRPGNGSAPGAGTPGSDGRGIEARREPGGRPGRGGKGVRGRAIPGRVASLENSESRKIPTPDEALTEQV